MASAPIRLFDTLQRKKVEFVPLQAGHVGLYACGPTVYGFIHIGNARAFVAFDVVVRHLRARGYQVTFVRNVTDVDDKIIRRARELGEEPTELANRFLGEFHADMAELGCVTPDVEPRVTDHLGEIVALIEKLLARNIAYEADGDVYFAVHQFAAYGQLSHQPLEELRSGARVEVPEERASKKRDPLDFALWKAAKPDEPSWPAPWGRGRPGWHIECSAMAERYLGPRFDIHGGGIDLTFPHHENERAQSQGAHGTETFARHWMHNGFVNFNGGKISRSDEAARVLFDRAFKLRVGIGRHGGEAVRAFLLTTQYRHPIQFEVVAEGEDVATAPLRFPGLEEAERRLEYGYLTLKRLGEALANGKAAGEGGESAPEAAHWLATLQAALDDDFNTAEALAALLEAFALTNRILDGKLALSKEQKRRTLERLQRDLTTAQAELGLWAAAPDSWLGAHRARRCQSRQIDPAWVDARLRERAEARKAKDFARADGVRAELSARGVEIMDTPLGTSWRVAD